MTARPDRAGAGGRRGLHLVVIAVALLLTVYLAFQVLGALVRLGLLLAAVLIALVTYRAWRRRM
jgi:hypothetical protein